MSRSYKYLSLEIWLYSQLDLGLGWPSVKRFRALGSLCWGFHVQRMWSIEGLENGLALIFIVFSSHNQSRADFKKVTGLFFSLPPPCPRPHIINRARAEEANAMWAWRGVAALLGFNSWAFLVFLPSRHLPGRCFVMKSEPCQLSFLTGLWGLALR